jgi:quinol monooxygenase YgiN
MTQPYPSTIRMDIDIYRDRQARERELNRAYMQSMIARAKAIRGEPEDEDEDEDDLSDIVTQLTCRDGRNGGACND